MLNEGSLEWSCWIMNYIITENIALESSNIYTEEVFNSLVSYIRARGAPYKHKVINLLTLMLNNPEKYGEDHKPDLSQLNGVRKTIFNYMEKNVKEKTHTSIASSSTTNSNINNNNKLNVSSFLPRRVTELVEMTCYASLADAYYNNQLDKHDRITEEMINESMNKDSDNKPLDECANDVIFLTECLYNQLILNINTKENDIPLYLFIRAHKLCEFEINSEIIERNYIKMRKWNYEMDYSLMDYISMSILSKHNVYNIII